MYVCMYVCMYVAISKDSYVERSKSLPGIVKAFRRVIQVLPRLEPGPYHTVTHTVTDTITDTITVTVIQAYLPADQGQLLIDAAAAVAELHNECREHRLG